MSLRTPHPRRGKGMILAEACVALALIATIVALSSTLLIRYSLATDYYLNCRRVQLGVESQIDRLRAGALAAGEFPFTDDGGITYTLSRMETPEAWQPLTAVVVVGEFAAKHGKIVRVEARAMIPTAGGEGD